MKGKDSMLIFTGKAARGGGTLSGGDAGVSVVGASEIRKNLESFGTSLKGILTDKITEMGNFRLESLSVAVGVDGKGKVGFLGTGTEVGTSATITLTFKESKAKAADK